MTCYIDGRFGQGQKGDHSAGFLVKAKAMKTREGKSKGQKSAT